MKLAVFGQRAIEDEATVRSQLHELSKRKCWYELGITYLYGGAKGPQRFALDMMDEYHDTVLFQPWSMVTNKLGEFNVEMFDWRNKQILDNADEVVIFDDGTPDREADYVLTYVRRYDISYHVVKM